MHPTHPLPTLLRRPAVYWSVLLLAAAATPLAFAPYYQFWLMPLLFGVLVWLTELRPPIAVRSAYVYGLVGYAAQFYWIHTALHDVSGLPNVYALPLTLLLPAYLALYPAACFWLLEKARLGRGWRIGLLLPLLWTLAEFARERALTGFGWGALGYSQIADSSPLAGYAPLGGLHLVTLACAGLGAWLVLCATGSHWRQRTAAPRPPFCCWPAAGSCGRRRLPNPTAAAPAWLWRRATSRRP